MNDQPSVSQAQADVDQPQMNASSTSIPAFDILSSLAEQKAQLLSAVARVLDSGTLILGPEVTALEREFAKFVHAPYAVGTSSGTDAILVALRALALHEGSDQTNRASSPIEVITTANGPVPTVAAIRAIGANPKFVDIDARTLQVTTDAVEAAITDRTACVVAVHLYGYPAPSEELAALCRKRGLLLIEDCAQAHGTMLSGRHVGVWGDAGCFSFYPTKNLGALGDAGLCVTKDAQLAECMREQACYGFRGDRVAHVEGLNCRLDELQAALLRVRLQLLPQGLERRQHIAAVYLRELAQSGLQLPWIAPGGTASWHQFVIRVKQRAKWLKWFSKHAIGVGIHYAWPIHLMPAYRCLGYKHGSLPATEQACDEVISLPIYPELSDVQQARVIEVILSGTRTGLH